MELSIIIINYNTADLLDSCLSSILKYTSDVDLEILVFDNNSTDHTQIILTKYHTVKKILHTKNIGFAAANNIAVESARGKHILFLNPDTEIKDNILFSALQFFKKYSYDILGVRLRLPNGTIQVSTGNFPKLKNMYFQNLYLFLKKIKLTSLIPKIADSIGVRISQLLNIDKYWNPYETHIVDWISGAFLLIRKNDFLNVGKFDEEFVLYAEEIDLCCRLGRNGKKTVYYGAGEILHHSGAVLKEFKSKNSVLHDIAMLRYYQKHSTVSDLIIFRITLLIFYIIEIIGISFIRMVSKDDTRINLQNRIIAYKKMIPYYLGVRSINSESIL